MIRANHLPSKRDELMRQTQKKDIKCKNKYPNAHYSKTNIFFTYLYCKILLYYI